MDTILRGLHIEVLFWLVVPLLFVLLVLYVLVRLRWGRRGETLKHGKAPKP